MADEPKGPNTPNQNTQTPLRTTPPARPPDFGGPTKDGAQLPKPPATPPEEKREC